MLYFEFINQAQKLTIHQLDNGTWYLDPEWKNVVRKEIVDDMSEVEEGKLEDWWDVENMLELEVARRNAADDKKKDVIDWLYDVITAAVEPAIMQEETDYIKNVIEFMRVNHSTEKDQKNE